MTDAHLSPDGRTLTIHVPMTFKTRGGRKLVISPDGVPAWAKPRARIDNTMVKALARAFQHAICCDQNRGAANRYIRRLLVIGATSMLRYARAQTAPGAAWVNGLLERRPARLVTVAMANKTARIAWALLAHKETYRAPSAPAMVR